MHDLDRRQFLYALSALPFIGDAARLPIIDTHIHLFDTTRPEGSVYPGPNSQLGTSALPSRYREVVKPFGIVGAIVIEAQLQKPRIEDNQWVLDQAAKDPIIVGTIGRLDPGSADFGKLLDRFRKDKLFLGIRQNQLGSGLQSPPFVGNLKLLADAGLTLDSIPQRTNDAAMAFIRVTDLIPSLRLVIEHYPSAQLPEDQAARNAYMVSLRELGKRPHVYIKLSEVVKKVDGKVSPDLSLYKDWLDQLWDIFGEDRVMYGSDWPQSETLEVGSYPNVISVARAYVGGKGSTAMEKVFWKNSIPAYRWIRRDPSQPTA